MELSELTENDYRLLEAARDIIRRNFDAKHERHTVGAAFLCGSGKIYSGVNIYANCGFGPCAEPVALGQAISAGERDFLVLAAVGGPNRNFKPLAPCGNCRQILNEYGPNLSVIVEIDDKLGKVALKDMLPLAYKMELER